MAKPRFTAPDIARILTEAQQGVSTEHLCDRYGISVRTLQRWQAKARVMESVHSERLRVLELEHENRRLKQKVAELSLDYHALRVALVQDPNSEC
ncbi:MAG: transposase [Nitrospiraceae bacterium]|nr:transposase [Nitrospiraceae bacterium]